MQRSIRHEHPKDANSPEITNKLPETGYMWDIVWQSPTSILSPNLNHDIYKSQHLKTTHNKFAINNRATSVVSLWKTRNTTMDCSVCIISKPQRVLSDCCGQSACIECYIGITINQASTHGYAGYECPYCRHNYPSALTVRALHQFMLCILMLYDFVKVSTLSTYNSY